MKKLLLLTLLASCVAAEAGQSPQDWRRARGDDIASKIVYIRDSATKLCFAYGYVVQSPGTNSATGGPMLANVSCEAVKAYLLNPEITAERVP